MSVHAPLDEALLARAKPVRVVGFDVDGVCTDGKLYYGPAGEALHAFHARDGLGIVRARKAGLVLVAITGRTSKNVQARLSELGVPHIVQGVMHKDAAFEPILREHGCTWAEAAFIGDDVNDLPCLTRVALAACVPDAARGVRERVHMVTEAAGGSGALREFLELILRAQGLWTEG